MSDFKNKGDGNETPEDSGELGSGNEGGLVAPPIYNGGLSNVLDLNRTPSASVAADERDFMASLKPFSVDQIKSGRVNGLGGADVNRVMDLRQELARTVAVVHRRDRQRADDLDILDPVELEYQVGTEYDVNLAGIVIRAKCLGFVGEEPYFEIEGDVIGYPEYKLGNSVRSRLIEKNGELFPVDRVYIGATLKGQLVLQDMIDISPEVDIRPAKIVKGEQAI